MSAQAKAASAVTQGRSGHDHRRPVRRSRAATRSWRSPRSAPTSASASCAAARTSPARARTRSKAWRRKGLELLREAGERYDLLTCTEVVDSAHVEIVDAHVDILQVGTAQHGELLPAQEARGRDRRQRQAGAVQARDGRHDRGVARRRGVHHDAQPERHPVRARDPHVRDLDALHARHHGGAGGAQAVDAADHRGRVAPHRAARPGRPRCARPRSRSAPTG